MAIAVGDDQVAIRMRSICGEGHTLIAADGQRLPLAQYQPSYIPAKVPCNAIPVFNIGVVALQCTVGPRGDGGIRCQGNIAIHRRCKINGKRTTGQLIDIVNLPGVVIACFAIKTIAIENEVCIDGYALGILFFDAGGDAHLATVRHFHRGLTKRIYCISITLCTITPG